MTGGMYVNTSGIVLRETAYKDSSKILTVLTATEGKLTVSARGAMRKNSVLAASAQLLVFSEMTLFSGRDRWTLTEARSIEQFQGLRRDVALLAIGSYFAELTETVSDEDSPNPDILRLLLNALFALSEGLKPLDVIKPAFELRIMSLAGLAPLISHCAQCGSGDPEHVYLDAAAGTIYCASHFNGGETAFESGNPAGAPAGAGTADILRSNLAGLGRGALAAARYVLSCDIKKIFSFSLGEDAVRELYMAMEKYLLTQLDRSFRTLDYFRKL